MSIKVQTLLTEKSRKYGTSETSVDFQQRFLDAFNYVLDDIQKLVGVATTRINNIGEEADLDQQRYQSTISRGLDRYLDGQYDFTVENLKDVIADYKDTLASCQMSYHKSIDLGSKLGDLG